MPWPTGSKTHLEIMMKWRSSWLAIPTRVTLWAFLRTPFPRLQWRNLTSQAFSLRLSGAELLPPNLEATAPPCPHPLPTPCQALALYLDIKAKSLALQTGPEGVMVQVAPRPLKRSAGGSTPVMSRPLVDMIRTKRTRVPILADLQLRHTPTGSRHSLAKDQPQLSLVLECLPPSRTCALMGRTRQWPLHPCSLAASWHRLFPKASTASPAALCSRNPLPMSGPWMAKTRSPMTPQSSNPLWSWWKGTTVCHSEVCWIPKAARLGPRAKFLSWHCHNPERWVWPFFILVKGQASCWCCNHLLSFGCSGSWTGTVGR